MRRQKFVIRTKKKPLFQFLVPFELTEKLTATGFAGSRQAWRASTSVGTRNILTHGSSITCVSSQTALIQICFYKELEDPQ